MIFSSTAILRVSPMRQGFGASRWKYSSSLRKAILTQPRPKQSQTRCTQAAAILYSAGGAGYGVIESAKENGAFVIGVDTDQSYLAPENMLTSAMKNVNIAVELLSTMAMNGEKIGGKTFSYGLAEGCVGIPKENPNMSPEDYEEAMKIQKMIIDGKLIPPATEDAYETFLAELKGQEG